MCFTEENSYNSQENIQAFIKKRLTFFPCILSHSQWTNVCIGVQMDRFLISFPSSLQIDWLYCPVQHISVDHCVYIWVL